MVGDYVMTQLDCEGKKSAPDPVALGSFGMDSHVVQHFVTETGYANSDGVIWRVPPKPYGISYRSIIPRKGECENLFSPICVSASHVAHGSIRMEPVFMALSQSAAIAAGVAIDQSVSVQGVPYPALREKLLAAKQIVDLLQVPAPKPKATTQELIPSPDVLRERFLGWRFGMFIHFNMATFNNRQWATGTEDPATFAPAKLDCGQWLDAAAAAGMKYAMLTVKHTCGYCLWDSQHTETHDIRSFRNFRNGQGDLVREFVEACRKRGIKVGLYYCLPGDFAKRHLPKGEEDKLHGLPPEAQGRYTAFIKLQLSELLTGYGPIDLLWFDQYSNRYTKDDWQQIRAHVKSHQPGCVVIANNSLDFKDTDIHSYEYPYLKAMKRPNPLPPEGNVHAAEVCDTLGLGWFWTPGESEGAMKSVEQVTSMLELCKKRRANYLLNVGPDDTGRLPDYAVKRLREIGARLTVPQSAPDKP
jgi:alpha-L-fucosidase